MSVVAFDTNVLAYAARVDRDPEDRPKIAATDLLLEALASRVSLIVPLHAFGELYNLLRRAGLEPPDARARAEETCLGMRCVETSAKLFEGGLDLAVAHRFKIWDALIVNTAAGSGADFILSEDMQDGFRWGRLQIVNPYNRSLEDLLKLLPRPQ